MTEEVIHRQLGLLNGADFSLDIERPHYVGMETPPLDIGHASPSIPRVKLPDISATISNLSEKARAEDAACSGLQSHQTSAESATADSREEVTPALASEPSLPLEKPVKGDSDSTQRTSTESSGSRSKTYSIAELVELGYRSRRVSRDELRLSDEAPIEHIFPGVATERAFAEVSSIPARRRNHRRGLSTQSLSSGSDREEFTTKPVQSLRQSESLLRPRRQPRNPPDGSLLQNDTGFAHFLKQHASPPHKRVTAGGRIVPAGPNSPPPTFKMEAIDAILQGNPQGTWPSRYSAPPPQLREVFRGPYQQNHMNGGNLPNMHSRLDQNGIQGNPMNPSHQRSQTISARQPHVNSGLVYPAVQNRDGIYLPEGAEYLGLIQGIHVADLHGRMGHIDWINNGRHIVFTPFDIVKPIRPYMQQRIQQAPNQFQFPGPFSQAINGYPPQPVPGMLPITPTQQHPNGHPGFPGFPGFSGFPGFPGMNGPTGVYPNVSTGFVPGGNSQGPGFVPLSNSQVRGTPSLHIPTNDSLESLQAQLKAVSAQYDAYQKARDNLERYAALHNDEFDQEQQDRINQKRKESVLQLDETRKKKMHLEHLIQCEGNPKIPSTAATYQPSQSRQSSNICEQGQGQTLSEMAKTAIEKDEKERELHKATKKFSPDAPVFVPSASAGFNASPQKLLEGLPPADAAPSAESALVLNADAAYCARLGFNNPSEPKQFCTEPWEFTMVIKAAHDQARRYGCEGGQSKDPEWDAEQDIRWAMQDELPIPLVPEILNQECEGPWNWANSYYNVRKGREANWKPPRYVQESTTLPPTRPGRFSRGQSVDVGLSLHRAQSAVPQLSPVLSVDENSALTVIDHTSGQVTQTHDVKLGDHIDSLADILSRGLGIQDSSVKSSLALPTAKLRSRLSETNLALHNGQNASLMKNKPSRALSRQSSSEASFITNVSLEGKGKATQPIKVDVSKIRENVEKTAQLMKQYAESQHDSLELRNVLEPLAEICRRIDTSIKGKERSPRHRSEQTEIVQYSNNYFGDRPSGQLDSSKAGAHRGIEGQNAFNASFLDKTNNELKTVLVATEHDFMTKSMTKRQASHFARSLIASQSPEQPEGHSTSSKTAETPKSNAQRRLLSQLNFASGDENLPLNNSSTGMMYKARSSLASPTFEARGLVHSPGNSTEVQPPTPIKGRDRYTDHDLGLMRKASDTERKEWANEGFRNPGNRLAPQRLLPTRASENSQEQKMTRAQRYQARHRGGNGHGHGTTEW